MATTTPSIEATATLADFVASTQFDQLPVALRVTARRQVLDTLGVAIAGAVDPEFAPVRSYVSSNAGRGEIPAPTPRPLDVGWAAFTVGVASHLLDYDDVHTLMGHPSCTLLPVVLSLGYVTRASGAEVLRAVALGTEVEARIGGALNPAHYGIGWHPTSVMGPLGAAAAAATLLRLDASAIRRALGIAASHSGGTKANFGTSVKSMHAGIAARAGVEAALLARAGATANDHILEEQFGGFCELFTTTVNRSRIVEGLGETYLALDPGVAFKLLPCCGSTQASAWGVIDLWDQHHFDPKRIKTIHTGVDPLRMPHTNRPKVSGGLEGKFSTQYCQATAALTGKLGLADFKDEAVRDPERQAIMQRVRFYASPDAAQWPDAAKSGTGSRGAMVEIEMEDGTVLKRYSPGPRGYPELPASDADITKKFLDCASHGLEAEAARRLADDLLRLEEIPDVAPLIERTWAGIRS